MEPQDSVQPITYVELRGITKRFPGTLANDEVSLEIRAGEVLALLGENGAGKTTLMNILYGLYQPDAGEIRINGRAVKIQSPHDAIQMGIGMVHQHFMLVPTLTVSENVALGLGSARGGLLDLTAVAKKVRQISEQYGLAVNPDAYVWQLSVGEQQRAEIVKALYRGANLLILDEPTAVLTPQEADELITLLRGMAAEGRIVVFISHKLNEVMAVSDRVSVLRGGRLVQTMSTRETSPCDLARTMVGRDISECKRQPTDTVGDEVLELRDVWADGEAGLSSLRGITLSIRAGEILGVAGVSGNGQKELAEVINGLRRASKGKVMLHNRDITNAPVGEIVRSGIGYIPEDRLHVGIVSSFSVSENLILKDNGNSPYARSIFLDERAISGCSGDLVAQYGVKTPGLNYPAGRMSGGNIQRLILAREITRAKSLLVAAHPVRGLDAGATEYVHTQLLEARQKGLAVLLISEDIDEICSICDRVAVMYEGGIMGILPTEEADEQKLGLLMAGVKEAAC